MSRLNYDDQGNRLSGFGGKEVDHQVSWLHARGNPLKTEDVVATARRLHGWFPPVNSFLGTLDRYIWLTDEIVKFTGGKPKMELTKGSLLIALACLYANSLPYEQSGSTQLLRIAEKFKRRSRRGRLESLLATAGNLGRLEIAYSRRVMAVQAIRASIPAGEPWGMPPEDVANAAEHANSLARRIQEQRKYVIKPCIIDDGWLHLPDDAWVFRDGIEDLELLDPYCLLGMSRPLAITHLAERSHIKALGTEVKTDIGPELTQVVTQAQYPAKCIIAVQFDGRFTLDVEYGLMPLMKAFIDAGRTDAYDIFRWVHLTRLSHIVLSHEGHRRHNSPKHGEVHNERPQELTGLFRPFVVPRIRFLDQEPDDLLAEPSSSQDSSEAPSDKKPYTPKARHEVPGFVRPLPKGTEATSEAKARAKKAGVILGEGETFVKTHNRGSRENKSAGHIARERRVEPPEEPTTE